MKTPDADHACSADRPVCPTCGHRWSHYRIYSDGSKVYTSHEVIQRYLILYGEPTTPFQVARH